MLRTMKYLNVWRRSSKLRDGCGVFFDVYAKIRRLWALASQPPYSFVQRLRVIVPLSAFPG